MQPTQSFTEYGLYGLLEVGTVLAPSCEKIAMDNVNEPGRHLEKGDENSLANLDLL